jgi:ATP-dependent Lon protease
MFIATANHLDPVPGPLRDRMEVIHLSGYTEEEKLEIAKRYLVPRQIKDNGISSRYVAITDEAIKTVISQYTREAGLRNLEREIGSLCRKIARKVAEGDKKKVTVTATTVKKYLGPPRYLREDEMEQNEIGIVTGLAWTPVGGEVLHVEATIMKGKGALTITGSLGDVMKESVQAALSWIRSRSAELHLSEDLFSASEIHVHVPAGAIPKDGPSAGITMATALVSALTKIPVKREVAMTGEITLRGKVLPIGGLKEKMLAAIRAGITTVIIPEQNKKDLEEIPKQIMRKVTVIPVKGIEEVLKIALETYPPPAVAQPVPPTEESAPKQKAVPRRSSPRLPTLTAEGVR